MTIHKLCDICEQALSSLLTRLAHGLQDCDARPLRMKDADISASLTDALASAFTGDGRRTVDHVFELRILVSADVDW